MENRAGFWIRLLALIIDGIIIGIAQYVLSIIFGLFTEMNFWFTWTINLVLIYYVWFQTINKGQTFGKRITNIRVTYLDGGSVSLGSMALREIFGKAISSLILFIGYLMAAGKNKRALHDYIAKTIVIKD